MEFEGRLYNIIGERIRNQRRQANLTQEQLARQLGLTRTSVTNIENGQQKIQLHTLYTIAKSLDIPIIDLLPDIELVLPTTEFGEEETLLEEKIVAEQLPQDLKPEVRKWILDILAPTDE